MNTPNFTPSSTNGMAQTVAEKHGYPPPLRPPAIPKVGKLRQWLIAGACGLLVGGAAATALAYQVMPVKATPVERMIVDIDGDGAPDFLVSGWVVFAPKAPASQTAGQP